MDELIIFDQYITDLIDDKPGLEDGIKKIKLYVTESFNDVNMQWLSDETVNTFYKEFEEWLNNLLVNEPLSQDIIALNFGLFELKDGIQLHISGSSKWDVKNTAWACNDDYFPEGRFARISVFKYIMKAYNHYNWAGIFLSLAIVIIFVSEYSLQNENKLICKGTEKLHLAAGFDDGDLYNI